MNTQSLPYLGKVALVGRVNVGKSTLFNRLCGGAAIVSPIPGATRDRVYGRCSLSGEAWCELIDCGGYQGQTSADFWRQSNRAIQEAKLALLLLDGAHGPSALDHELALQLKTSAMPTAYIITKQDQLHQTAERYAEFFHTIPFLHQPLAISATTGGGIGELRNMLSQRLRELSRTTRAHHRQGGASTAIAIVGKPNSGKSSLLNTLVSQERSCVSDVAGTTRDPVDVQVRFFGSDYRIFDTAGVRRRTKVAGELEQQSVSLSLQLIQQTQLTVLVVDGTCGFTDQDAKIARLAHSAFKPLIVVVSKWDLVKNQDHHQQKHFLTDLRAGHLANASYVPIRFVSSVTKYGVARLYSEIEKLVTMSLKRVPTATANQALGRIVARRSPHLIKSCHRRTKFYYITQVTTAPPTFVIKCNVADAIKSSYKHYLEKSLRQELGFTHIPIRVFYRPKTAADRPPAPVRARRKEA